MLVAEPSAMRVSIFLLTVLLSSSAFATKSAVRIGRIGQLAYLTDDSGRKLSPSGFYQIHRVQIGRRNVFFGQCLNAFGNRVWHVLGRESKSSPTFQRIGDTFLRLSVTGRGGKRYLVSDNRIIDVKTGKFTDRYVYDNLP